MTQIDQSRIEKHKRKCSLPSINIIIMNNIIKIHDCMTEKQDMKECRTGAVGCYRVGRLA